MHCEPEESDRLLEKKLRALSGNHALPATLVKLVAATCREQWAARNAAPVHLRDDMLAVGERNLRGAPLLPREEFPVDQQQAQALFTRLEDLASACEPYLASSVDAIAAARKAGDLDLADAFARFVRGDDAYFVAFGQRTPNAPRLLNFLVQASLTPQLAALGEAAYAFFPKEQTWNFGHCPVCASQPLLARLVNREGARGLTCSFCQVEYRAKRLMCPYCGEEDPARLELFTADEVPGFAVQLCLSCHSYLKTVDFRDFDRPSLPVLDDLESLSLDVAAQHHGYVRPVLSAWGF